MKRIASILFLTAIAAPALAADEVLTPVGAAPVAMDGLWVDPPTDYDPNEPVDIRALVEMDGNPDTLTDEEAEMLAFLEQVMMTSPIETPQP
ncbi:hypothetical protein [Pelagovum pacificum]|uniref:Uncharacterized protein n=1 Tax=Pelagovum pacificum TaxID=2588711 RepID=A0A5C5GDN1_9RHOB|nr:hypothetical protein [Pelagovum pacificum]QQA44268.1 hypothetical protein I8N54_06730 [Pelagovum pacificum]TNY32610.1 hypothetical protein FHY64_04835 [Pelagovum pacificum]